MPKENNIAGPMRDGCGERRSREIVAHKLFVSSGNTAEVVEPVELGIDAPTISVTALVTLHWPLAVGPTGNDGDCLFVTQGGATGWRRSPGPGRRH